MTFWEIKKIRRVRLLDRGRHFAIQLAPIPVSYIILSATL